LELHHEIAPRSSAVLRRQWRRCCFDLQQHQHQQQLEQQQHERQHQQPQQHKRRQQYQRHQHEQQHQQHQRWERYRHDVMQHEFEWPNLRSHLLRAEGGALRQGFCRTNAPL